MLIISQACAPPPPPQKQFVNVFNYVLIKILYCIEQSGFKLLNTHFGNHLSLLQFDAGARIGLDSSWEPPGAVRSVVSVGTEPTKAAPPAAWLGPIPRSHYWNGTLGGALAPSKLQRLQF